MKSKVLVSSILTIALCLSLIAGSTFALFTDETKFGIEVTSGDVEIYATAGVDAVWSADGPVAEHDDKYLKDENDNYYKHVDPKTVVAGIADNTFINGGNAEINGSNLSINRITPGDKVDIQINVENRSDVAFRYRYTIKTVEDTNLATGMILTTHAGEEYLAVKSYTSEWFEEPVTPNTKKLQHIISLELPVYAGNEFQSEHKGNQYYDDAGNEYTYAEDIIQSVNYTIIVEAVQGNAVTTDAETFVEVYPVAGALDLAVDNGGTIKLDDSYNGKKVAFAKDIKDVTFDANNTSASFAFTGKLDNVTIANVNNNSATGIKVDVSGATGDVTIKDSEFACGGTNAVAIKPGLNVDVTADNCTFVGSGKSYAVYNSGVAADFVFTGCTFEGMGSWAYMVNGSQYGDLVVDGCTFVNCTDGLFKSGVKGAAGTTGTLGGDFVFTNNTITNCSLNTHNWFGVSYVGDLTFENNTMDGAAWNVADYAAIGIKDTNP